ncbi:MAG: chromate transporter [Armatimonadota bacterium]
MSSSHKRSVSLWEIAKTFLTIGAIGFGGGMAVIALIQERCVVKKQWMESDEFSHGMAFGQILGPFAVNASLFVGYRLRGLKGAVVAAIAFLIPSVTLVIGMSALYNRFQHVPSLKAALKGIGPVVVALILSAAYQMGKSRVRNIEPILLMLTAVALSLLLKLQTIVILLIAVLYGFAKLKLVKAGDANADA